MITNKNKTIKQNNEKPASSQNKVRADIFSGSLAACLSGRNSLQNGKECNIFLTP
jgi:hypothetical protein